MKILEETLKKLKNQDNSRIVDYLTFSKKIIQNF